jgi:hypothetical protein
MLPEGEYGNCNIAADWPSVCDNIHYSPCPSMTIRRVPSNLNTTGKVGMASIGYTVSTKPSSKTTALFWLGITKFLQIQIYSENKL